MQLEIEPRRVGTNAVVHLKDKTLSLLFMPLNTYFHLLYMSKYEFEANIDVFNPKFLGCL